MIPQSKSSSDPDGRGRSEPQNVCLHPWDESPRLTVRQPAASRSALLRHAQNGLLAHAASVGKQSGPGKDGRDSHGRCCWGRRQSVSAWECGFGFVWAGSRQRGSHLERTCRGRGGAPCLISLLGSQGEGEEEGDPEGKPVAGSPQFELPGS